MKKRILVPVFFLFAACLMAQGIPQASQFLSEPNLFKDIADEILLPDSSHGYIFDGSAVDSMLVQKQFYVFNEYGQPLSDSSLGWLSDTTGWLYIDKNTYLYDDMNRLTDHTTYEGNWLVNSWIPHYQYLTSYIGNSDLVDYEKSNYFEHDIEMWRNNDSTYNHFNSLDQIEYADKYFWRKALNIYEFSYYNRYVYNDEGLMTSDTTFSYWTPGVATKSYLKVYEHDNQGNRIERRAYYWSSNNTWEEVEKHEYTYDANGNRTASYRYDWDETLSEWFMYERVLITYQANNIPYQVRAFELNMDTGLWEPEFTFEYFASLHFIVQSPETPADGQPLFYPNPTNGLIQTKDNMLYDEVNVYDSMGKLLLQLKDVNEIDLRPFPAGMYFIDLQNDGKHVDGIQKMIKK